MRRRVPTCQLFPTRFRLPPHAASSAAQHGLPKLMLTHAPSANSTATPAHPACSWTEATSSRPQHRQTGCSPRARPARQRIRNGGHRTPPPSPKRDVLPTLRHEPALPPPADERLLPASTPTGPSAVSAVAATSWSSRAPMSRRSPAARCGRSAASRASRATYAAHHHRWPRTPGLADVVRRPLPRIRRALAPGLHRRAPRGQPACPATPAGQPVPRPAAHLCPGPLYHYRFTAWRQLRSTGAWGIALLVGDYLPPVTKALEEVYTRIP